MRKTAMLLAIMFMSSIGFAQINFKTGDAALETELNQVNAEAKVDLGAFKDKLLIEHGLAGTKVDKLLDIMQPAEVLLSGRLKDLLGIDIDIVVESYNKNKDKGWGVIAKDLGIKPGSPEFHALKGKSKNSNSKNKGKGNGKSNGKAKGKSKS